MHPWHSNQAVLVIAVAEHSGSGGAWAFDLISPEHTWRAQGATTEPLDVGALALQAWTLISHLLPPDHALVAVCNQRIIVEALQTKNIDATWDELGRTAALQACVQRVQAIIEADYAQSVTCQASDTPK